MERTCSPHPKILLFTCILQIWEINPKDLGTLTPYLPHKRWAYVHRILVNSTPLYKHRASSSQRYMKVSSTHTFRIIRDSSIIDLTFEGFLAGTPPPLSPGALYRFFTFLVLQVPSTIAHVDNQLTNDFVHNQFPSYDKCGKANYINPRTKSQLRT